MSTETKDNIETLTFYTDDDAAAFAMWGHGVIVGRSLTEDERDDLSEEQVVEAIENSDYFVYVNCNKFRDRCYINITDDPNNLDDGSFAIDASQPPMHKLLRAIDNEHCVIVRRQSGNFTLAYYEDLPRYEA